MVIGAADLAGPQVGGDLDRAGGVRDAEPAGEDAAVIERPDGCLEPLLGCVHLGPGQGRLDGHPELAGQQHGREADKLLEPADDVGSPSVAWLQGGGSGRVADRNPGGTHVVKLRGA